MKFLTRSVLSVVWLLGAQRQVVVSAQDPNQGPTQAPTSNDCESLSAGDIYFYLINSVDPDEVAMFLFADLPGNLDLYMTDNAWNGQSFLSNEGTLKLSTPPQGIPGGTSFGYGTWAPFGNDWVSVEGQFSLTTEGDQVFLYCFGTGGTIHPLAAISYAGNFSPPGQSSYGLNQSALPSDLEEDGTIVLPHEDNWIYNGPDNLEVQELKWAIRNTTLYWKGGSQRFSGGGRSIMSLNRLMLVLASTVIVSRL